MTARSSIPVHARRLGAAAVGILLASTALSGCTREATASQAAPTEPLSPAATAPTSAAPSAPTSAPSSVLSSASASASASASTPAASASPTSPASTASPASPATITEAGTAEFIMGAVFVPSATQTAQWNPTCGAWLAPSAADPQRIGFPTEGGQKATLDTVIVLAPGSAGPTGVAIGMSTSEIAAREPKAVKVAGPHPSWTVTVGQRRMVYASWDGGKTVGSIAVQDASTPYEPFASKNPCA